MALCGIEQTFANRTDKLSAKHVDVVDDHIRPVPISR